MTQPQTPSVVEYKECFKCNFRGDVAEAKCPRCGKVLRTAKNIRIRGIVLVVTGLFLIVMMAGLAIFIGALMTNAAHDPATARKIADQGAMLTAVYALFGVIALFGLNGLVMGTWQIVFGRRNRVFIWIMFGLLALILIACFGMVYTIK
jgi:uncharacterized paraquat-inducible protein A